MTGPRVVVLGLDGATWDLIEPWARAGALPNLASLMSTGSYGELESTLPYVTPLAWPAITTGTNPGKHGLLGFRTRKSDSYDWPLSTSTQIVRPAIWDLLAKHELSSAALFIPFSYPARPIRGAAISGAFSPRRFEAESAWPKDLVSELKSRFDERLLFAQRQSPNATVDEVADLMVRGVHEQTNAMVYTIDTVNPDFVFTVWHDTDKAAHIMWHHSDLPCPDLDSPMFRIYKAVDEGIAKVLDACGGDPLVIVCSDHGTCPITHRVKSHLFLERLGLLKLRRDPQISGVSKAGRLYRRAPTFIKRAVPTSLKKKAKQKVRNAVVQQNALVDWSATTVYPQPVSSEAFFLNTAGREPAGRVVESASEEILERLTTALMELQTDTGDSLVKGVYRRDEIFKGPMAHLGPDLVADGRKGTMFVPSGVGDRELIDVPARPDFRKDEPSSVGYHQRDGIYLVSGPGVKPGKGSKASVTELAPTILRYLNLPVPTDMDGVGLTDSFEDLPAPRSVAPAPNNVTSYAGDLTREQEAEIERHLKDLGYVE